MSVARKYDVVVYGATGFTGRLVCEYVLNNYGAKTRGDKENVKFAFAGRSLNKLQQLAKSLEEDGYDKADIIGVDLIVADAFDIHSLVAMAEQSKVVLTTVGPYTANGELLVSACVKAGSHYCDLTGEINFVRTSINKYHKECVEKKIKITHCCGFDSIPSDLGTLLAVTHYHKTYPGTKLANVDFRITDARGGVSGGTLASFEGMLQLPRKTLAAMADPFYLVGNSDEERKNFKVTEQPNAKAIVFDPLLGRYTVPFIMEMVNSRVVRRSNFLLSDFYSPSLRYSEMISASAYWIRAFFLKAALSLQDLLMGFAPTRWLLMKFLPKQGEGPSKKARDNGYFWARCIARSDDKHVVVKVGSDKGDGGYKETAKMLFETALSLAFPKTPKEINDKWGKDVALPLDGGVLTPASASGLSLVDRLNNVGMTFKLIDDIEAKLRR